MLAPRTGDTGHHLASGLVGKLDIVPKSSPQLRQAPDFIKNTISPLLEQADLDPAHDTHAEEPPQRFTLSGGAVDGIIFMSAAIWMRAMQLLEGILVPLVMAIFLSTVLVPVLDMVTDRPLRLCKHNIDPGGYCVKLAKWEQDKHWSLQIFSSALKMQLSNGLGVLFVLVLLFSGMFMIGWLMYNSVVQFLENIEPYENNLALLELDFKGFLLELNMTEYPVNTTAASIDLPFGLTSTQIKDMGESLASFIVMGAADAALILLYVTFLLAGRQSRIDRKKMKLTFDIEKQLKVYSTLKFAVSALTGVLVAMVLSFLGVDLAAPFGLMAFCLNFIPNVGSVISTFLPMPIVILSDISYTYKMLGFLIPFCIQFAVGNFIEPMLFGSRLAIHPITVLFALVLWNELWGITGAFLSVPITCAIKILLVNINHPTAHWMVYIIEGEKNVREDEEEEKEKSPSVMRAAGMT